MNSSNSQTDWLSVLTISRCSVMREVVSEEGRFLMVVMTSLYDELLAKLRQHGVEPDPDHKDQHLLISREAITQLIEAAKLCADDVVLEVGPGPGHVTREICGKAGFVHAIELDERFTPMLSEVAGSCKNLEVAYGSALEVGWPREVNKFVANPPYSILEPLLMQIIRAKNITTVCMTIGEEYYRRCTAPSEHMTRTSLLTNGFFNVELVTMLDKDSFFPRSRERSVIMRLARKDGKKSDFGMRKLASRIISMPNETVAGFLRNLIGENIKVNVRTLDLKSIPTVRSLGLDQSLEKTRLGELDNTGITKVIKAVNALKRNFRHL